MKYFFMLYILQNKTQGFLSRLSNVDRNKLDSREKVNFDILKDSLETFIEGNLWAE